MRMMGHNVLAIIVAAIFDATIGAILLLLVVRLVRGGGYFDGGRWGGWGSRRY